MFSLPDSVTFISSAVLVTLRFKPIASIRVIILASRMRRRTEQAYAGQRLADYTRPSMTAVPVY